MSDYSSPMYRMFNIAISSNQALPELPEFDPPAGMAVVRFVLASKKQLASQSGDIDWGLSEVRAAVVGQLD